MAGDTEYSVQQILNRVFDPATNTLFSGGGAYHEYVQNAAAKGIASVHAAVSGNGTLQTISTAITSPITPRALSITDSSVSRASGTCVITGVNAQGETTTESLTIVAGTTVSGSIPFATVTSYTVPATVGGAVSAIYVSSGGTGFPSAGELTITGGNGAATFTFGASANGVINAIDTITASGLGYVTGAYTATTGSTGSSCFVNVANVLKSTLSLGTTDKIGLSRKNITAFKTLMDGAEAAVSASTINGTYGTIIPVTTPNGTADFDIWYKQ